VAAIRRGNTRALSHPDHDAGKKGIQEAMIAKDKGAKGDKSECQERTARERERERGREATSRRRKKAGKAMS